MSDASPRPGPARLRDVALAARVSAATASRSLNGSLVLSPASAERILGAFDDVGPLASRWRNRGGRVCACCSARLRGEPIEASQMRLPVPPIERHSVAPPWALRRTGRASINRRV